MCIVVANIMGKITLVSCLQLLLFDCEYNECISNLNERNRLPIVNTIKMVFFLFLECATILLSNIIEETIKIENTNKRLLII